MNNNNYPFENMNKNIPTWMNSELAIADQEGRLRFYVTEDDGYGDIITFVGRDWDKAKAYFDSLPKDTWYANLRVAEIVSGNEEDGFNFDNDATIETIDNIEE